MEQTKETDVLFHFTLRKCTEIGIYDIAISLLTYCGKKSMIESCDVALNEPDEQKTLSAISIHKHSENTLMPQTLTG